MSAAKRRPVGSRKPSRPARDTSFRRKWRRSIAHNAVFIIALLGIIALGFGWSSFMRQLITEKYNFERERLYQTIQILSFRLGHAKSAPQTGTFQPDARFEIIPTSEKADRLAVGLEPFWPMYSLSVTPAEWQRISSKFKRQQIRWIGEGAFWFLLISVSVIMLYRLVATEIRAAEESSRVMDLFTHELKTPLAGIRALLQSVAMRRIPETRLGELGGKGIAEVDRLEHLVENILIRNRMRMKDSPLQIEVVELRSLVAAVLERRAPNASDGLTPVLEPGSQAFVSADKDAVRVIVENLLDNAHKYGGSSEPPRLEIRTGAKEITLSVTDTGIGIEAHNLDAVFEPYYREREAEYGPQRGTGLGLSISQALAKRMRGKLTAHSHGRHKGATFTLHLTPVDARRPEVGAQGKESVSVSDG